MGKYATPNKSFQENIFTDYIREITYGGSDGIVTTFTIIAGFTGANSAGEGMMEITTFVVLLFGFASLLADAISMGLGDYLSSKAEDDVYDSLVEFESQRMQEDERLVRQETYQELRHRGFSDEDAASVLKLFTNNERFWQKWLVHERHGVPDPGDSNPLISGLVTAGAFFVLGGIPLLSFWIYQDNPNVAFFASLISVLFCWLILGMLRWVSSRHSLVRTTLETVGIGSVAASIAFVVGWFIG